MKKILAAICAFTINFALVACTPDENLKPAPIVNETSVLQTDVYEDITYQNTTVVLSEMTTLESLTEISASETLVTTDLETTAIPEFNESIIKDLFSKNLTCMEIFTLRPLRYDFSEKIRDNICPVISETFADYASFESYIRSVYIPQTANRLLYDTPYEDDPIYVNIDGRLCINANYDGGRGYYVDWSNYTVDIISVTEDACEFTVSAVQILPGEDNIAEDYSVSGRLILCDGEWRLEEMIV